MHSDMSYPYITYTYTCKGETFDVPEVVPFRLTQNMVHAMVCLHAHTHTHTKVHITVPPSIWMHLYFANIHHSIRLKHEGGRISKKLRTRGNDFKIII